ncbi:hypothetical protein EBU24_03260 [bacterium]|nr:hypothetical protein [bacterium]
MLEVQFIRTREKLHNLGYLYASWDDVPNCLKNPIYTIFLSEADRTQFIETIKCEYLKPHLIDTFKSLEDENVLFNKYSTFNFLKEKIGHALCELFWEEKPNYAQIKFRQKEGVRNGL